MLEAMIQQLMTRDQSSQRQRMPAEEPLNSRWKPVMSSYKFPKSSRLNWTTKMNTANSAKGTTKDS